MLNTIVRRSQLGFGTERQPEIEGLPLDRYIHAEDVSCGMNTSQCANSQYHQRLTSPNGIIGARFADKNQQTDAPQAIQAWKSRAARGGREGTCAGERLFFLPSIAGCLIVYYCNSEEEY
jgi:hypothetical protein